MCSHQVCVCILPETQCVVLAVTWVVKKEYFKCIFKILSLSFIFSLFVYVHVQTGINGTSDILSRVSNTTQELQSQSDALNSSLSNVAANIVALNASCAGIVTECNNIPPGSDFIPGADFNQVSCRVCVYTYSAYCNIEWYCGLCAR